MKYQHINKTIRELLQSKTFIFWCFFPTPDLDIEWNKWIEENPDKQEDLFMARQIIQSGRLNDFLISEDDFGMLAQRLSYNLHRRKRNKWLRIVSFSTVAACILVLIGIWKFTSGVKQEPDSPLPDMMTEVVAQIDTLQTEIELSVAKEKVMITDKSSIQVDTKGVIQIKENNASLFKKIESDQDHYNEMNTLKVPHGRRSFITLSDGTKAWVNAGTVLMFPAVFEEDNRTIYADGEIYLEVVPEKNRPFLVKTGQIDVRVLGTSFNLTTYKEEEQSVVLVEGSVEVSQKTGMRYLLKPEERFALKDGEAIIKSVDVENYISWKDGIFIFRNEKLEYVLRRLSKYYRIQFDYPEELGKLTCSGKLVLFDDINSVMITLKESFPLSYHINKNSIDLRITNP